MNIVQIWNFPNLNIVYLTRYLKLPKKEIKEKSLAELGQPIWKRG
jgi:hypothetical protein